VWEEEGVSKVMSPLGVHCRYSVCCAFSSMYFFSPSTFSDHLLYFLFSDDFIRDSETDRGNKTTALQVQLYLFV